MSQPLTTQEKNIASRYGNNNFSLDAFNRSSFLPQDGSSFGLASGPVPYKHQDILAGKKQSQIAGDYRTIPIDYRRAISRAASHAPFNFETPFMGQP